mgnify:CR=1 FL=1
MQPHAAGAAHHNDIAHGNKDNCDWIRANLKSQMKTVNPENDFLEPPLHSAVGSGHLEKSQKKNPECSIILGRLRSSNMHEFKFTVIFTFTVYEHCLVSWQIMYYKLSNNLDIKVLSEV